MHHNSDTGENFVGGRFQETDQNQVHDNTGRRQTTSRDATLCPGGFTMIPPNESKRHKLLNNAQKEEEDWRRFKEENRHGPIQTGQTGRLGGVTAFADVRQRQQMEHHQSKWQKKLKKEEMEKKKRQAEEEEIKKMKAIQREKALQLDMRKQQEDQERQRMYQHDQLMKQEQLFLRLQQERLPPVEAGRSAPASCGDELSAETIKQGEEREQDLKREHRRVNQAFLDRLQAGATYQEQAAGIQDGGFQLKQEPQEDAVFSPEDIHTNTKQEYDADLEWTVMKLLSHFPHFEKAFVEDIVSQCNGDFQQAFNLLRQ